MTDTAEHISAMQELAEKAADQLQGTCNSLYNLGEEYEGAENDKHFCACLDNIVFRCTACEYWFFQSEMSDEKDWICED